MDGALKIPGKDRREVCREVMDSFLRMVNKYRSMEKFPLQFGAGVPFFHSERHMLEVFAQHPDLNITDLAGKVGVTKGAISQIAGKLEKKGAVERYKDAADDKQVKVRLTGLGRKITDHVRQVNEQTVIHLCEFIGDRPEEQVEFLTEMFDWIETYLDEGIEQMQGRHGR